MRLHKDVKTELIRRLPLFAGCTPAEIAEVAAIADEIDLQAGRVLARENAIGREFVAIIEGTATVQHGDTVIATLHAGDFFGEIALLTGHRRIATVVAATTVHALVIEGHAFVRLMEDAPQLRATVERAMAERLAAAV